MSAFLLNTGPFDFLPIGVRNFSTNLFKFKKIYYNFTHSFNKLKFYAASVFFFFGIGDVSCLFDDSNESDLIDALKSSQIFKNS
jgi:hypothetical protein